MSVIEFVDSVRTIVITTVNPCSEDDYNDAAGDGMDDGGRYALKCTAVSDAGGGNTTVTLKQYNGSTLVDWNGTEVNKVILALNGDAKGRCFTILSRSTDVLTIAGEHVYHATTNPFGIQVDDYFALVHTTQSMYEYCNANDKECVYVACGSINWNNASPEKPKSYASHITLRIGTGKFKQSVSLGDCSIWYSDPRFREFILNKFNELLFKWHMIQENDPVYLIITTLYYNTLTQETAYQNRNFFHKTTDFGSDVFLGRGYMKGFPMGASGKTEYNSTFSIPFEESWQ